MKVNNQQLNHQNDKMVQHLLCKLQKISMIRNFLNNRSKAQRHEPIKTKAQNQQLNYKKGIYCKIHLNWSQITYT